MTIITLSDDQKQAIIGDTILMMIGVILTIKCNERNGVLLKHVDDNQNLHCRISAAYVEAVKLSNCKCVLVVLSVSLSNVSFFRPVC